MSASRRDDCKTFFFVLRFRLFSSEPRPKTISETMARSTSLALILSAILGIANAQVAVLDGGLKAWKKAGMPVQGATA